MLKQNKGITLVALVITIIVLLILAGVSISLVVGDNGVLTRATDSSSKTKISQIKEAVGLALSDIQTKYMAEKAEKFSTTTDTWFTEQNLAYALSTQGYHLKNASATVPAGSGLAEKGASDTVLSTTVTYHIGDSSEKDAIEFTFKAGTNGYTIANAGSDLVNY